MHRPEPRGSTEMRSFWIYVALLVGAGLFLQGLSKADERIGYARFRDMAENGQLIEVEIKGDTYVGHAAHEGGLGGKTYKTGRIAETEQDLLARLDAHHVPTRESPTRSPLSRSMCGFCP